MSAHPTEAGQCLQLESELENDIIGSIVLVPSCVCFFAVQVRLLHRAVQQQDVSPRCGVLSRRADAGHLLSATAEGLSDRGTNISR